MRVLLLLLGFGCRSENPPCGPGLARVENGRCLPVATAPAPADDSELAPLEGPRLLRRISLDLRGIPPTLDELEEVQADPSAVERIRDRYLDDPRLEERLVHLLHEVWHTRVDELQIHHFEYPALGADDRNEYPFERAVGEEPLRLMARVAMEDRPWTEILTADWTMATPMLEGIWPLALEDESASGWSRARYTDGRPAAGVLSTNGLWWRYYTTASNYNRARAATLSRLLVCDDLLARPVSFVSLEDAEDGGAEAIRTNPGCIGCHATIDPTAAALFGFYGPVPNSASDNSVYHPERALDGPESLGVEPAWYGQPVDGLGGLALTIAADPRFVTCTTKTFAGLLWQRDPDLADAATLSEAETRFRAEDLQLKALLQALTDSPAYRVAEDPAGKEHSLRLLSPDQLASAIQALTGLDWTWEGFSQLDNDTYGYRLLLGGVDGIQVTTPLREPGLTAAAVHRRLAWAGGAALVEQSLGQDQGLLAEVELEHRPGDPPFDAAVQALCMRAHGQPPTDALRSELSTLWSAILAESDPATAWTGLVAAVLADPLAITY